MEYRHGHAEVLAEGFGETANFTIAASGKAFKSLIDGLYSRKIEAVMRELATNAFDAHLASDSIAPFEVHLPTILEPTFYIRDFGTGMSHDVVMRRYTTLFDSTKDGLVADDAKKVSANKQVGMLGLGSKSFFAYTDSCTITVWMDGEVRLYTVFMGANGVPTIALAGKAPSDEPRGVKVEFAAKAKDINEFQNVAIRVFKGFPVAPTGLPTAVREALAEEPAEIGTFWKAYGKKYLPDGGFYARQGCVLYPIDLAQIKVEPEHDPMDHHKDLRPDKVGRFDDVNLTIVMDFAIGDLEFDVSRERLAYTDDTIAVLRQKWRAFIADLDVTYEKAFKDARTNWERRVTIRTNDLFSGLGPLFESSSFWREAKAIDERIEAGLPRRRGYVTKETCFAKAIKQDCPNKDVTDYNSYHTAYYFRETYGWKSSAVSDCVLVYNDLGTKARAVNLRIEKYLVSVGKKWAMVFAKGGLTLERYRAFGCPKIVRLSEMAEPPKAPSICGGGDGPPPFERFKLVSGKYSLVGAESEDDVKGHLFCFINRGQVVNPDPERYPDYTLDQVMAIHRTLRYFKRKSISFINIRKNEKFEKFAGYKLFYGCLEGLIPSLSSDRLRKIVNVMNADRFRSSRYHDPMDKWIKLLPPGAHDPITRLQRFEEREDRIPHAEREMIRDVFFTGAFKGELDTVIELARHAGFEVLPPMQRYRGGWNEDVPIRLLPNRYEKIIEIVNQPHNALPTLLPILRDFAKC